MDLSRSVDWLKIFDQSYYALPDPTRRRSHQPIPAVNVNVNINSSRIGVLSSTSQAKPHWTTGVNVYPIIPVPGAEFNKLRLRTFHETALGETTLITIKKLAPIYQLLIAIPPYFVDVSIAIWSFQGQEEADTLQEQVEALRDEVAILRADVLRIEEKLDAMG